MTYKDIGERIRELREINRYSRSDLAILANISEKHLYEIESGKKKFSIEVLNGIAKGLSVSCDYILYGDSETVRTGEKIFAIISKMDKKTVIVVQDVLRVIIDICEVL